MSWHEQTSLNEIRQHVQHLTTTPIRITPLHEPLNRAAISEFQCKRVYGAHIYVAVPAFARLASQLYDAEGVESYQELTRAIHLYQQEVFRIVGLFAGYQVHFQGPKLHAVLYQPFGERTAIAARAVLMSLVLKDFAHTVFPRVFPRYRMLSTASGVDLGQTIVTADGQRNDRELLFIGSPANYAAKIITDTLPWPRLTAHLYDALPKELRALCVRRKALRAVPLEIYELPLVDRSTLERLLRTYAIAWEPDTSVGILSQAKRNLAPERITHRSEQRLIDLKELSISNNRRVLAASLFADVSGFTRYVQQYEHTEQQAEAIRVLHAIRREMSRVIRDDYGGLRIQFQGDRVQALFHLPKGDWRAIAHQAVEAARGLQASMERTLKACLPAHTARLHLAIGIDMGATLVSRLGVRAQRDPICLGRAVESAAELEEMAGAGQIAISRRVRQALPAEMRRIFRRQSNQHAFVAMEGTDK
jgi:class 3 adenylate cyclase